jgi:para-aminobenzoate synthetase component 1
MNRTAPFVCLDDSLSGRTLLFEKPVEILTAWTPREALQMLDRMERLRQDGIELAGYFGYELGYVFEQRLEPLLPEGREVPLISFGAFETARTGDLPPPAMSTRST